MIDFVLALIAMAANAGDDGGGMGATMGEMESGTATEMAVPDTPAFEAEDQTPSGKFTTAGEVRPILSMTRGNWVAVREYDGKDLVYVTHLMSWRCGMHQMKYAINDGPMMVWELPPCLTDTNAPNAIRAEDGLPFASYDLGSVQSVSIEILYDDLSTDEARFERGEILMP